MLTFLPIEQINEMNGWQGSDLNRAKEILAYELTSMVHGEDEAKNAEASAKALFGAGADASVPTTELSADDLDENGDIDVLSVLVKAGLVTSRSEARRAVEQGGVSADGEKVTDLKTQYTGDALRTGIVFRRGKKAYKKVTVK